MTKKYKVEVYDFTTRDYIGLIKSEYIQTDLTFTENINEGQGELVLPLSLRFDDWRPFTAELQRMNIVEVSVVNKSNRLGKLIYKGFITGLEPEIYNGNHVVNVRCSGIGAALNYVYYDHNYSTNTEIGQMARDGVNHVSIDYPNLFTVGSEAMDASVLVSRNFTGSKVKDVIETARELAGGGWWWKVAADGTFYFQVKPGVATHTFTLDKDVSEIAAPEDYNELYNDLSIEYNSGNEPVSDTQSITENGRREYRHTDTQLSQYSAQQWGADFLAKNKDGKRRVTLTVLSDDFIEVGYPIESISVGDTCQVQGLKLGSTVLNSNMQIVALVYKPTEIFLELEESLNFVREV